MCLCACFQGLGQGRWKILPNFTFLISPGMVMEVFTCQAFYNQYTLHLVVVNDRKKNFCILLVAENMISDHLCL